MYTLSGLNITSPEENHSKSIKWGLCSWAITWYNRQTGEDWDMSQSINCSPLWRSVPRDRPAAKGPLKDRIASYTVCTSAQLHRDIEPTSLFETARSLN